jgi:hypothetical protein
VGSYKLKNQLKLWTFSVNILKRLIIQICHRLINTIKGSKFYDRRLIRKIIKVRELQNIRIEELKNSYKVKVGFMMVSSSTWKYDAVYQKFEKAGRYKPKVVIIPLITKGREYCEDELKLSESLCVKNGYNYVLPMDKNGKWTDIKISLKPDLVFFSNPNALSLPIYHIENFKDCLTIYLPYSIRVDNLSEYSYNSKFSSLVWRNYYETKLHFEIAKHYSRIKAENVKVSGHPVIDTFRNQNLSVESQWKSSKIRKKKIIWAPHWTIPGFQATNLDWGAFLFYADFMLEIAQKYVSEIQLAFKPHPFLENLLKKEELWGIEKTSEYYKNWEELSNGQLEKGEYIQLFIDSDALIHDSGSFSVEYLELNMPILYTKSRYNVEESFNDLGKEAIQSHYIANEKKDIEDFIKNVVISGEDPIKENRVNFRNKHLNPDGKSSSDFIFKDIEQMLSKKE